MRVLFLYNEVESVGLEYLSKVLREDGHETALVFDPKLFDFFHHDYNTPLLKRMFSFREEVEQRILEYAPDVVGFQILTANYEWCCRLASFIREHLPETTILAGGYHATSSAESVLRSGLFDWIIRGEAEDAILEFMDSLEAGEVDTTIDNLAYLDGGDLETAPYVENPLRPYEQDLDRYGMADKELFWHLGWPFHIAHMSEWRRGCPWGCTFCGNNYYRRIYFPDRKDYMFTRMFLRSRTPDDVLAELRHVKATYDPPLMRINDDDICADEEFLRELAEKMTDAERIPFKAFVIPNNINERTIGYLKQIGCQQLQMGVQSLNPDIRKMIGRPNSDSQIARAIDLCAKAGIGLYVDQIFGLPGETEEDCKKIERFYREHRADVVSVYWLDIWAGADILQQSVNAGTITQEQADFIAQHSGTETDEHGCISTERQWSNEFSKPYARRLEIRNVFSPRVADWLIDSGAWKVVDKLGLYRWIRLFHALRASLNPTRFPQAKHGYDIGWARYPRFVMHFGWMKLRGVLTRKNTLPLIVRPALTARPGGDELRARVEARRAKAAGAVEGEVVDAEAVETTDVPQASSVSSVRRR